MFESSEDAMNANEALTYESAARELRKHGVAFRVGLPGRILVEDVSFRAGDEAATVEWVELPLRTRAILEFLGY